MTPNKTDIAPALVRSFMPPGYLNTIRERHEKKTGKRFADATISTVVKYGDTKHILWPAVLAVAKAEKKRREAEADRHAQQVTV